MIESTHDGAVSTLVLNRPERHNSLIPALLDELADALADASQRSETRAIVLAAEGRSFSTGGDVGAFYEQRDQVTDYAAATVGRLNDVMLAMMRCPQPIVAAVHGMVTGGSLGLVLASDVVLVAPGASFSPWYTVVGFSPDGGWTALLPAVIGAARARAVLLDNDTITAEDAVRWGLAHRLVPQDQVRAAAQRLAAGMAERRTEATARAKALLRGDLDSVAAALEAERAAFVAQIGSEEARRGMREFLSRR